MNEFLLIDRMSLCPRYSHIKFDRPANVSFGMSLILLKMRDNEFNCFNSENKLGESCTRLLSRSNRTNLSKPLNDSLPTTDIFVTQTEAELGRRQIFERPLPDGEQIHVVYIQPLLEFLLGDVHQCAFPLAHLVTGYLLALQGLLLALGDRQQEQKNEGEDGARRSFDHLDRRPSFFTRQHSVSLAETALFDEFI